ncbi:MAG: hypothetical protein ACE5F6_00365 [Anaerolineae bacterium]
MITRENIWWWLGGGAALLWFLSRTMGGDEIEKKGKPGELEITIFGPKEARQNITEILLSARSNCPSMPQLTKLLRVEGLVYIFEALFPDDVQGELNPEVVNCITEHVKTFSPKVNKVVARRVS